MIKTKCNQCKKVFSIAKNQLRNINYCSRSCLGKNSPLTKNQNFEKNHAWLNGVVSRDELIKLYIDYGMSVCSTSKLKKVSPNVITRRLKKYNIDIRTLQEQKKMDSILGRSIERGKCLIVDGSKTRNSKIYLQTAKDNFEWKCMRCSKKETNEKFDLIVHHKDEDNHNNDIKNLMVLCQNCHSYIHRKGKKFKGGYLNGGS